MNPPDFVQKWERQRARGRWVFALIHAAVFAGGIAALYGLFQILNLNASETLTPQMVGFAGMGGFAYGLIRFNIRERFYQAMLRDRGLEESGEHHDGS